MTRCTTHELRTPCASCAGDHAAGEHAGLPAIPSCPHCTPIRPQHTTHADRSTTR